MQVWEDQAKELQNEHEAALHLPWLKLRVTLSKKLIIHSTFSFFFFFFLNIYQVTDDGTDDKDSTTVTKTVTSESTSGTTVTTTTTHISKVSNTILIIVNVNI